VLSSSEEEDKSMTKIHELAALRQEILAIARAELHLTEDLPEDLSENLDSLQRLSLVVAIEDRYRICFEPEDDAGVQTLDDVTRLVPTKLAEQGEE